LYSSKCDVSNELSICNSFVASCHRAQILLKFIPDVLVHSQAGKLFSLTVHCRHMFFISSHMALGKICFITYYAYAYAPLLWFDLVSQKGCGEQTHFLLGRFFGGIIDIVFSG